MNIVHVTYLLKFLRILKKIKKHYNVLSILPELGNCMRKLISFTFRLPQLSITSKILEDYSGGFTEYRKTFTKN
jgi:hypothetical protein